MYQPMTKCPHCTTTLIDCFIVKNGNYLVCTQCAIKYIHLDPINFPVVFKDNQKLSKRQIEATNKIAHYLLRFTKISLKQLILNQHLTNYVRSLDQFQLIQNSCNELQGQNNQVEESTTLKEKIEEKIEIAIDTVSEMIPESVHLHYEIGKHLIEEKYKDIKSKSSEIIQSCSNKWDVFKDKIGIIKQELPSDASEIKEKLNEGLNNIKNKWKSFWK